jgi:hypothetical protein
VSRFSKGRRGLEVESVVCGFTRLDRELSTCGVSTAGDNQISETIARHAYAHNGRAVEMTLRDEIDGEFVGKERG